MSEQQSKKKQKQHHPQSHESPTVAKATEKGALSLSQKRANAKALIEREIEKLEKISANFSKIASQFRFENTTSGYVEWTVQLGAELDLYDLADVITVDPGLESSSSSRVSKLRQKIVYHMILHCISSAEVREVVTTALSVEKRTGFGAWFALREHYIGDEQAYLESLESKFETFSWEKSENWATFETRFTALVSELDILRVGKSDLLKRSRLMKAILESGRLDVHGKPIFDRLHVTNQINAMASDTNYRKWLLAIRTEAQKIQDEINGKKSVKRSREDESKQGEVSLAEGAQTNMFGANTPAGGHRFPQYPPRSGTNTPRPCHNMMNTGSCRFGEKCRYSHATQPRHDRGGIGGGFRPPGPPNRPNFNNPRRDGGVGSAVCWEFMATGKCRRGAGCRFKHENGGRTVTADKERSVMNVEVDNDMEVFNIESQQILIADTRSPTAIQPRPHRVIIDSGASQHLTSRLDWIRNIRPLDESITIRGAFGRSTVATQCGDGLIPLGGKKYLRVENMVYCDLVQDTLLSMCLLREAGHRFDLDRNVCLLRNSSVSIPLSAVGNILSFDLTNVAQVAEVNAVTRAQSKSSESNTPTIVPEKPAPIPQELVAPESSPTAATTQPTDSSSSNSVLAHCRYGHLCGSKLNELIGCSGADGLVVSSTHPSHKDLIANCKDCALAKMSRKKFSSEINHGVSGPNDKCVADVVGPLTTIVESPDGTTKRMKSYVSLITDVWSRNVQCQDC